MILMPCSAARRSSCGRRAIVPSSSMISQITAAGYSAGQAGQVDRRLGLPGAHEDAPLPRPQGEDVAGAGQVLRLRASGSMAV